MDDFDDEEKNAVMTIRVGESLEAVLDRDAAFLGMPRATFLRQILTDYARRPCGALVDADPLGQILLDALNRELRALFARLEALLRLRVLQMNTQESPAPVGAPATPSPTPPEPDGGDATSEVHPQ